MVLFLSTFAEDDDLFLSKVDQVTRGVIAVYRPKRCFVFRINNWFSDKWLNFAGKTLGAVGVWDNSNLIVPPFVQNRITAQSYFGRQSEDQYVYLGSGSNIHHDGASWQNFNNRVQKKGGSTAYFWFSGNTQVNGVGSIMGYIPYASSYWSWFLEYSRSPEWRISKRVNFQHNELQIIEQNSITLI